MMEEKRPGRLVIGIGASAGGIEAFKQFFAHMPSDSGMTFVLVLHLDPAHESILPAIIADSTEMLVRAAEDGVPVAANEVYVIPPDALLTIEAGILRVVRPVATASRRTSIDAFLTSLAEDQGEQAVGIILAGFGSDGARGISVIKERGGLTLTQADFDHHAMSGTPQSAAYSGFVDHVLSVEDMPPALLNYLHHRTIFDGSNGRSGRSTELAAHLPDICAILHARLNRDFSQYKTGTLSRRIQRRMYVLNIETVAAYVDHLKVSPQEAELLFRELLVGVTRFFRDAEAFKALEERILPELFASSRSVDTLRVWVAGCATGEEAYSIAILLMEVSRRTSSRRSLQVFATDVDDRAIASARAGLYTDAIVADLSVERLERNFIKEQGGYRVAKDIREICLFSTHDLVKDPPFSKLDLVSCRNLLIYFEPQLQQQILTTFHYALKRGGNLFLGPSESVATQARLFGAVDKLHRLYVRRDVAASFPAFALSHSSQPHLTGKRLAEQPGDEIDRRAIRAIARYTPSYIVVDRQHDVLRFCGQTAKYIDPATGVASLNLFNLLHANFRGAARAALKQAATTGERVLSDAIASGDHREWARLIVEPLADEAEGGLFLVAFQEVEARASHAASAMPEGAGNDDFQALNTELFDSQERLRTVSEELEAAHQELQASHEEFLSMNEELQSTNEELETSKEELQSLNEELQTINTELNHRNDSLARSNSDLANLLDSTSIATLFLDGDMRIRRFTPRLLEIFKVRDGDEGRPITDIVSHLTRNGLEQDVTQVLATLTPQEREVMVADGGASYLMQIRPYRDRNNMVDGTVVTFVDISERKRHERARALLAAIVESSQDAIISHGLDGIVTSWNSGAERLYEYSSEEAIGQPLTTLINGSMPDDWPKVRTRLEQGEQIKRFDDARSSRDGRTLNISLTISPVREGDSIVGASIVARDVSEQKAAEHKATLLLGELDHRVKNILAIVSAVVSQTLKSSRNPEAFAVEVEGRVTAIAKAHGLLTQAGRGEISLRAIVETELAPYGHELGNLEIDGQHIALTPRAAMVLAMAIHELGTNAAKYGALSAPAGRLVAAWDIVDDANVRILQFVWTETGGPRVEHPARRGFGTTLIERSLAHELDAVVDRQFLATGVRCSIRIPLTEEVALMRTVPEPVTR